MILSSLVYADGDISSIPLTSIATETPIVSLIKRSETLKKNAENRSDIVSVLRSQSRNLMETALDRLNDLSFREQVNNVIGEADILNLKKTLAALDRTNILYETAFKKFRICEGGQGQFGEIREKTVAFQKNGNVFLCEDFFKETVMNQIDTIIHEYAHTFGLGECMATRTAYVALILAGSVPMSTPYMEFCDTSARRDLFLAVNQKATIEDLIKPGSYLKLTDDLIQAVRKDSLGYNVNSKKSKNSTINECTVRLNFDKITNNSGKFLVESITQRPVARREYDYSKTVIKLSDSIGEIVCLSQTLIPIFESDFKVWFDGYLFKDQRTNE